MALLWIEGFEQFAIADEAKMARGGYWANVGLTSSSIIIRAGTRHSTPAGHEFSNVGTGVNAYHPLPSATDFIVGFAFKLNGALAAQPILRLMDSAGLQQFQIYMTTGGEIQLRIGASTIETTSGQGLNAGVWYYLELESFIDASTGNYDLHIDGVSVMSDTNVDTRANGTDVALMNFVGHATLDTVWDDIYYLDKTGSDNTDFLGDCRVETVFPDADGNENDFTRVGGGSNNFEAVDDGATADDDSTYNHSATATERELYGFAALAGDVGTVFGVEARMLVRKEEAGFREVRVIARNNVTEIESDDLTLGVNYIYKNLLLENNPDGGGDWTEATVNTAQFGIDLQT